MKDVKDEALLKACMEHRAEMTAMEECKMKLLSQLDCYENEVSCHRSSLVAQVWCTISRSVMISLLCIFCECSLQAVYCRL